MTFIQNLGAVLAGLIIIFSSQIVDAAEGELDEYPNGWTHRPIMEQFTSLGRSTCM